MQNEEGGELARAGPDGTAWSTPLAVKRGVVVAGVSAKPRTGVSVRLLNAGETSVSDSAGPFEVSDLIGGPYEFAVADTLSTLFHDVVHGPDSRISGYRGARSTTGNNATEPPDQPQIRRILVEWDSATLMRIQLPPIDPAFRAWCHIAVEDDWSGVIAAWLLHGNEPMKHAAVIAR